MGHKYITYQGNKPKNGVITEIALVIVEYYFKQKRPVTQWRRDNRTYTIDWATERNDIRKSNPFNYVLIAEQLRQNGQFKPEYFNLPPFECYWLDKSAGLSINFHKTDDGSTHALTVSDGTPAVQFGEHYPILPKLDREGHFFTTFQPFLLSRVIKARSELVEGSDKALDVEWILDLRTLINDAFSLIEITLNQIYIKAQFDPMPGWKFDATVLGDKQGQRFTDKLKWIRQITGNNLDIEKEKKGLETLRELRNHFNHFDPPSLVVTIEEASKWLNYVIDIGIILFKMRKALGVNQSIPLFNFMLQREVIFNPEPAFSKRAPLDSKRAGYLSSTWTK